MQDNRWGAIWPTLLGFGELIAFPLALLALGVAIAQLGPLAPPV